MSRSLTPVTLQISLAPSDYSHARFLLPHQVRAWYGQVDEILLTIDFHRSRGRFSERWEEGARHIRALAGTVAGARVEEVAYDAPTRRRVAEEFFGGRDIPLKDFRGGPYYSYFFALAAAKHRHVLHVDSDMFFGGGSTTWAQEATELMQDRPDVLITAPLSGPPRSDGRMTHLQAAPEPILPHAFRFDVMTSRLFLIDRTRFRERIGALIPRPPPQWKNRVIAALEGNPIADLPEHLFTDEMRAHGLSRVEFLGVAPGKWSLHPPYRGADFYRKLPELIARIERGDVPEDQRGDHDLNHSLVDWSEGRAALRRNRLWRRVLRRWVSRQ